MITANLADLERRVEAIVADANSLERVQILDETLIASTLLEASQLRRLIVEKRKGSVDGEIAHRVEALLQALALAGYRLRRMHSRTRHLRRELTAIY